MKLRELNGLIRKAEDKILIGMIAPDGRAIKFRVPKSLVLAGLKDAYEGEAATYDTQMFVDEDGKLRREGESNSYDGPTHDETGGLFDSTESLDDDDDLLNARASGALHDINVKRFIEDEDDIEDLLA